MTRARRTPVPFAFLCFTLMFIQALSTAAFGQACIRQARPQTVASFEILPAETWLIHLYRDLAPYWQMKSALGRPTGNFPTSRYYDGEIVNPKNLRDEFKNAPDWISKRLGRQYVRMISRQAFGYLVAYHMTGDERFFEFGKAGIDFLFEGGTDGDGNRIEPAFDSETGKFIAFWENGKPSPEEATTQDLSYALLGPGFYYYLTGDKEVLAKILKAKDFIFKNYMDEKGYLRWVNKEFTDKLGEVHGPDRIELVAQLDQLNAYMILLSRILPEPHRAQWNAEMTKLAKLIRDKFYSSKDNLFWGRIDKLIDPRPVGTRHLDFGHTIKSFEMLELVGGLIGDRALQRFSKRKGKKVLKKAFVPDPGRWLERKLPDGPTSETTVWWIHCKLDEAAANWSLSDRSMNRYLGPCSKWWLSKMVDGEYGGVWHELTVPDLKHNLPKAHLWKSAYHSFEHCLKMYIVAQAQTGRPATLYYAGKEPPDPGRLLPYYYSGKARKIVLSPFSRMPGLFRIKARFSNIR